MGTEEETRSERSSSPGGPPDRAAISAAFQSVYEELREKLIATILAQRSDDFVTPDVAEDAAQHAFTVAYDRWQETGVAPWTHENPFPYLVTSALNLIIRLRKIAAHDRTYSRKTGPVAVRDDTGSAIPDPDQRRPDSIIIHADDQADAARACLALSDRDRGLVDLWSQGLNPSEIAARTTLGLEAVWKALRRAHQEMRRFFGRTHSSIPGGLDKSAWIIRTRGSALEAILWTPKPYEPALYDHYVLGLSVDDIAREEGVSVEAIKERIAGGLEYLAKTYGLESSDALQRALKKNRHQKP